MHLSLSSRPKSLSTPRQIPRFGAIGVLDDAAEITTRDALAPKFKLDRLTYRDAVVPYKRTTWEKFLILQKPKALIERIVLKQGGQKYTVGDILRLFDQQGPKSVMNPDFESPSGTIRLTVRALQELQNHNLIGAPGAKWKLSEAGRAAAQFYNAAFPQ